MAIAFTLVVIIGIAALISTLALAGKSDENYRSSTKGNLSRLSWIYVVLVVILAGGLGLYLYFM
ncbi:hypothetical protein [Sutcliffiella halmapala]|uniref:hypothetical protein n=1 Tax=Sutcliffiella halmapala TaxID=79882 RepID=UPI000995DC8B|nr:hypothetical protein [Sutcliffiella halmapala]